MKRRINMKKLSIMAVGLLASTLYAGQAFATNAIIWDFSTSGNVTFNDNDGLHKSATVVDTSGNGLTVTVSSLHVTLPFTGSPNNIIANDSLFGSSQTIGVNNSTEGIGVHSTGTPDGATEVPSGTPFGSIWDGETFAESGSSQMNQQLTTSNIPVMEVLRLDLGFLLNLNAFVMPRFTLSFNGPDGGNNALIVFSSTDLFVGQDLLNDADVAGTATIYDRDNPNAPYSVLSLGNNYHNYMYIFAEDYSLFDLQFRFENDAVGIEYNTVNRECNPNESGCGGNTDTPEPGIVALLGLSLAGLAILRRKQ